MSPGRPCARENAYSKLGALVFPDLTRLVADGAHPWTTAVWAPVARLLPGVSPPERRDVDFAHL